MSPMVPLRFADVPMVPLRFAPFGTIGYPNSVFQTRSKKRGDASHHLPSAFSKDSIYLIMIFFTDFPFSVLITTM